MCLGVLLLFVRLYIHDVRYFMTKRENKMQQGQQDRASSDKLNG